MSQSDNAKAGSHISVDYVTEKKVMQARLSGALEVIKKKHAAEEETDQVIQKLQARTTN